MSDPNPLLGSPAGTLAPTSLLRDYPSQLLALGRGSPQRSRALCLQSQD